MIINDISTILLALIQLAKMVVLLRLEEITKCPFVLVMLAAIDRWCLHRHIQMSEAFVEIITVVAISIIQVVLLLIQTAGEHCNLIRCMVHVFNNNHRHFLHLVQLVKCLVMEFLLNLLWAVEIILLSSADITLNIRHNNLVVEAVGIINKVQFSDWGGQMDVSGGTNERNAAATRSFLGGGSNVGSSSTQWNSGGDWGGTLGANNRAGASSRYNTSYNKPASGSYSWRKTLLREIRNLNM
uniref:Uncharacterized protein n=1 Tax=Meloidogyne enterolobii TaxID=390850 RepID=A0A6V7XV38_MELEN|nr:unnamed protein product [Meloidogyne enterolobii]